MPIAAAAVKYAVGYVEKEAPNPLNSTSPIFFVSCMGTVRAPETRLVNNMEPNFVTRSFLEDVNVTPKEIGLFGVSNTLSPYFEAVRSNAIFNFS